MVDSEEKNTGNKTKLYTTNANRARPAKDGMVSSPITDPDRAVEAQGKAMGKRRVEAVVPYLAEGDTVQSQYNRAYNRSSQPCMKACIL